MPAEAQRLRRRFGTRDRLAIGAAALAAVLATTGAVAAAGSHVRHRTDACLRYSEAGALGGGTWRLCGAEATVFCARRGDKGSTLLAQCLRVEHLLAKPRPRR